MHFEDLTPSERGQAAVEFAVTLPLYVFLLVGVIELGEIGRGKVDATLAARMLAWGGEPGESIPADAARDRFFADDPAVARVEEARVVPTGREEPIPTGGVEGGGGIVGTLSALLGRAMDTRTGRVAVRLRPLPGFLAGGGRLEAEHTVDGVGIVVQTGEWLAERLGIRQPPKVRTRK